MCTEDGDKELPHRTGQGKARDARKGIAQLSDTPEHHQIDSYLPGKSTHLLYLFTQF